MPSQDMHSEINRTSPISLVPNEATLDPSSAATYNMNHTPVLLTLMVNESCQTKLLRSPPAELNGMYVDVPA